MTDADMIEAMARVFSARDGIHELDHENRITRDFCSNLADAALARQTERVAALEKALKDATAHLAAATSAYERFCRRGVTGDALYTTRLNGFEAATSRARATLEGRDG